LNRRILTAILVSLLPACAAGGEAAPEARAIAPAASSCKPTAPLQVHLAERPLGGGDHEVTLTATATRDVPALELSVGGRRVLVGATAAGASQTLTTTVHVADGEGLEVTGGAAVVDGIRRRNAGAVLQIGKVAAKPVAPTRTVILPDGTAVGEVR
jgi:hypothetical protein